MVLKVQDEGQVRDIPIRAGEMFLLPPKGAAFSPRRMAGSVGLVVERKRLASERDGLMWYCPACNHLLYEEFFALEDIERDLPPVLSGFMGLWSGGLVRFVGLCILGGLDGLVYACGVRGLEPFGTRREYVLVG